jgi:Ca2+-transporting ATPase
MGSWSTSTCSFYPVSFVSILESGLNPWHLIDAQTALHQLGSDSGQGLSPFEAAERLVHYGPNELVERSGRRPLLILWGQLKATMVLILLAAAGIAALLGDLKDAVAILGIVVLFVLLGFIQEYRAERAIVALKKLIVPAVTVLRGGVWVDLSARDLVPGDVIRLQAGDLVQADLRLLEAANLEIQEASLTGESETVSKLVAALKHPGLALGDRRNMAYMGTVVAQGRGVGLAVATGMDTELGRIADLIQQVGAEQTPLQRRLDRLGKTLALAGVGIALLILFLGLLRGDDLRHLLLTAVSVAVAIVPEGLPAVVTITLALGAQRMLKRQALIRRLPAVETLGSVTVICSDKTGTLTENRMTVMVLDVADTQVDLSSDVSRGGRVQLAQAEPIETSATLALLLMGGALCNDARLMEERDEQFYTLGDPTEGALLVAAAKAGLWKKELDDAFPRIAEVPFDSDRRRMTTVHRLTEYAPDVLSGVQIGQAPYITFTKGSVDGLLDCVSHIWVAGQAEPLDAKWRKRIQKANDGLASKGMRVLGGAFRLLDHEPAEADLSLESGLTFVGLFGLIDPPRTEVREAVATCRRAGIRPVMITGDHPLTALEIARQLGIISAQAVVRRGKSRRTSAKDKAKGKTVLTGAELDQLSFDELKSLVDQISVYARVSPEHKLKIVQALQARGQIVSMTGDGVNDAPALRQADIGVAMGLSGTDVSKEASDLVLLDDNFATIVAAVGEGRTIYDNIRKFVRFSVAGNLGKVLVMLLAPFLGKPIPLEPLQLLWLNLLTDGLLGLGMGVEGPERDTMQRPPNAPDEGVFARSGWLQVIWVGALIGGLALALGAYYFFSGRPEWQTVVFTFLAFVQVFQALGSRSNKDSLFKLGLLSNPILAASAALVIGLQLAVLYVPFLRGFFNVLPLNAWDLSIAVGAGVLVFAALEIEKRFHK